MQSFAQASRQQLRRTRFGGEHRAALPPGTIARSARTGASPEELRRTRGHIEHAREQPVRRNAALGLLAEELRLGHHALSQISGVFSTEDLP
jgi:hypothetical protein